MDSISKKLFKTAKKQYSEKQWNCCAELVEAACCIQLGEKEDAVDLLYDVLQIESGNISAWKGFYKVASTNPTRYYPSLVPACLFLLKHESGGTQSEDRRFTLARSLLEVVIEYRLEIPSSQVNIESLCQIVFANQPGNLYAIEAYLRLQIEYFLVETFPVSLDASLAPSLAFQHLQQCCSRRLNLDFKQRLDRLDSDCRSDLSTSSTAQLTVQLGRLTLVVADKLLSETPCADPSWSSLVKQLTDGSSAKHPCWLRPTSMDIHACLLYALVTYKSHAFDSCNSAISAIFTYLDCNESRIVTEANDLVQLAPVPFSQDSRHLTVRPSVVPFRCSGPLDSSCTLLRHWLTIVRLANLAASEFDDGSGQLETDVSTSSSNSPWSEVERTCLVERCLTSGHSQLALDVVQPDLLASDSSSEQSVMVDRLNFTLASSPDRSLRWRTCIGLLACHLVSDQSDSDELTRSTALIECLEERVLPTSDSADDDDNVNYSARDHCLFGQLLLAASSLSRASRGDHHQSWLDRALVQFELGAKKDRAYYVNHLCAGRIFRRRAQPVQALQSFDRAHQLMPQSVDCVYHLALALCDSGQLERALEVYSKLDPGRLTESMYLNYGMIALRLARTSLAVPILQRLVSFNPANVIYWQLLGEAYLARGNYETAVKVFTRAESISVAPHTLILCGRAYRKLDEYIKARDYFERALTFDASSASHPSDDDVLHRREYQILALKELVELNSHEASKHMQEGLPVSAYNELEIALYYLDKLFHCFLGRIPIPYWVYHLTGSAFNLLTVMIDDSDHRIRVPSRLALPLRTSEETTSKTVTDPIDNSLSDQLDELDIPACLQLGKIYLLTGLRQWYRAGCMFKPSAVSASVDNIDHHSLMPCLALAQLGWQCLVTKSPLSSNPEVEFAFKRCLRNLATRRTRDLELRRRQLDADCGLTTIADDDQSSIANRLAINASLRSLCWYGLATWVASKSDDKSGGGRDNSQLHTDMCLCSAALNQPSDTVAGISFALRAFKLGHSKLACKLLRHHRSNNPDNWVVWSATAQLDPGSQLGDDQSVLQSLVQSACTGSEVRSLNQLVALILPLARDTLCRHDLVELASTSSSGESVASALQFIRVSLEAACASLDRAIAHHPLDYRLWHKRGLLLQFSGLSFAAKYCLYRAFNLLPALTKESTGTDLYFNHQLILAQYLLLSLLCNEPDWSLAERLIYPIEEKSDEFSQLSNCALSTSIAEACAKGLLFLHRPNQQPNIDLARYALIDELHRLAASGQGLASSTVAPECGRALLEAAASKSMSIAYDSLPGQFDTLLSLTPSSSLPYFGQACTIAASRRQLDPNAIALLVKDVNAMAELDLPSLSDCSSMALHRRRLFALLTNTVRLLDPLQAQSLLTRFLQLQPDDPDRWALLACWMLDQKPSARKGVLEGSRRCFLICRHLQTAHQLYTYSPTSQQMATALSRYCSFWIKHCRQLGHQFNSLIRPLLPCIQRSAALFPDTFALCDRLGQLSRFEVESF